MDREALKNMLNNLINDKQEEATLDLHNYLSAKMKDVTGFATPASEEFTAEEVEAIEEAKKDPAKKLQKKLDKIEADLVQAKADKDKEKIKELRADKAAVEDELDALQA